MTEQILWHYTTYDILKRILKQKAILPDRTEPDNQKERPTVTFSSHQDWEPTRYRVGRLPNGQLIMMNKHMLNQFCGGIVRIGIDPSLAPMSWHHMRDEVGLSRYARKAIYDFAISVGARTSHWYGSFNPIPENSWTSVQKLKDETWVDLEDSDLPNLEDVNLNESVSVFDIKFDKLGKPTGTFEEVASVSESDLSATS